MDTLFISLLFWQTLSSMNELKIEIFLSLTTIPSKEAKIQQIGWNILFQACKVGFSLCFPPMIFLASHSIGCISILKYLANAATIPIDSLRLCIRSWAHGTQVSCPPSQFDYIIFFWKLMFFLISKWLLCIILQCLIVIPLFCFKHSCRWVMITPL